jgi:tripartite-type tricarboxylate transporter receptor subunit TctC
MGQSSAGARSSVKTSLTISNSGVLRRLCGLNASNPRRQFLRLAVGAATLAATAHSACAQSYPTRPITLIVPFAAGGATDTAARILAERMRLTLGQPLIIENVPGANGSIGVGRVARAAPDGYTLVEGIWSTHVANGAVYSLQYDLLADFEPVSLIADVTYLIVARKTVPANDLKGFIAWLKADPDTATEATPGAGSAQHVAGALLQKTTGTHFQFVPYRGGAPAMQAVVAGNVDWMMANPNDAVPQIQTGNIRAYAVMAKARLASAPDIPTVDEAGLPGFYLSQWGAIWAPKSTPKAIIARLNAAIVTALADANVRARFASLGFEIPPRDRQMPEALSGLQKAEIERWWPIIKELGIRPE